MVAIQPSDFSVQDAQFELPIISLIGRPNVGKSTLFNLLTKTRNSLVADKPGVTRDRIYGLGKEGECPYWLIDTGGMLREEEILDTQVDSQAKLAVMESDIVFLLVDAKSGLQPSDQSIIQFLRQKNKSFYLLVNKIDTGDTNMLMADFYSLGIQQTYGVSSTHKEGIKQLINTVLSPYISPYKQSIDLSQKANHQRLNMTVIGRPNSGKSTLINRFLGEERMIASSVAGTTRDSVSIPFEYNNQQYTLVDTAGVRRKSKVSEHIEKISVIKTLQSIDQSNVILLMMDAHEGIGDLDAHLLRLSYEAGKALVIAINKWDNLSDYDKFKRKQEIEKKISFVNYAKIHYISALHGTGIRDVLNSVNEAYKASFADLSTNQLTQQLQQLIFKHQPPLVRGYSVKMRYAHQGGKNPPLVVIHGTRLSHLQPSYLRYLEKGIREKFGLFGTPVKIQLKDSNNPYTQ